MDEHEDVEIEEGGQEEVLSERSVSPPLAVPPPPPPSRHVTAPSTPPPSRPRGVPLSHHTSASPQTHDASDGVQLTPSRSHHPSPPPLPPSASSNPFAEEEEEEEEEQLQQQGGEEEEEEEKADTVNALHASTSTSSHRSIPPPSPAPNSTLTPAVLPKTKENMPSLGGINNIVRLNSDIPSDLLARHLLQGEEVVGQFDTFYPEPTSSLSPRLEIYLTIFTLGFYQVIKAFLYLFRVCRHLFCSCDSCRDGHYFHRAKLMITSRGRCLHWKQSVKQQNHFIDQQTHHNVQAIVEIYQLEDLAQVTIRYSDQYHCLHLCAHDYLAGVCLTFNAFDRREVEDTSRYSRIRDWAAYLRETNRLFIDVFLRRVAGGPAKVLRGNSAFSEGGGVSILLLTHPRDHIYDGECGLEAFEDLLKLHSQICSIVTHLRPGGSVLPNGIDLNTHRKDLVGYIGHQSSSSNAVGAGAQSIRPTSSVSSNCFPPTFLSSKDLRSEDFLEKFGVGGGEDSANVLPGVKELHNDLSNFTLCEADGFVNVPLRYLNLHKEEEVIAAVGMRYKWSFYDLLVYYVFSVGGLFRFPLFQKRVFNTSAIVLTSHRVVEIVLTQLKGKVPTELGKMDLFIHSFYPKEVYSGSIQVIDGGRQVLSTLLTANGVLQLRLPSTHLVFAQRMHLVTSRIRPLALPNGSLCTQPSDLENQFYPDLHHLRSVTATAGGTEEIGESVHNNGVEEIESSRSSFNKVETLVLPLLPREGLLHVHNSGTVYRPFAYPPQGLCCCCTFFHETPNQMKGSRWYNCGAAHLVRCLTCGRYPEESTSSAVMTNHTLFYLSYPGSGEEALAKKTDVGQSVLRRTFAAFLRTNCCGARAKYDYLLDPFVLVWVPLRAVRGQKLVTINSGAKPLAQSVLCCNIHTRSFQARYVLHVETTLGLTFPFAEEIRFKAWQRDARLTRFLNALSAVQTVAQEEEQRRYLV